MDKDKILSSVDRLGPWFHCIDLGNGIKTKTASLVGEAHDHPLGTWQVIRECLPQDLSGRSVLDVGCNAGFYSVESRRRGATRVLGIDARRFHVRQAQFVSRALGLDIDFRRMSVYDLSPTVVGQFDITLALGLIYHCKHLVQALENLWLVTKEILILETAIYPPGLLPESFMHLVGGQTQMVHTLAYIENPSEAQESAFNWFLPGVDGLQALLRNIGFDRVEVFKSWAERAVLVCYKKAPYADSRVLSHTSARLKLEESVNECLPGEDLFFKVEALNSGFTRWLATGEDGTAKGAVRLGTHLLAEGGDDLIWEYGRAELECDVEPGQSMLLNLHLRAPRDEGTYYIEFDMVVEHLSWLEDEGSPVIRHKLVVTRKPNV